MKKNFEKQDNRTRKMYNFLSKDGLYEIIHSFNTSKKDEKYREEGAIKLKEILDSEKKRNVEICDIGAGKGHGTKWVKKYIGDISDKIIAVDISEGMIKNRIPESNGENIEWHKSTMYNLPVKSNSLDAVTAFYSLGSCTDFEGALKETRRVLKDDGHLLVVDATKPKENASLITKMLAPLVELQLKWLWNHQRYINPDKIIQAGFERIDEKCEHHYFLWVGSNEIGIYRKQKTREELQSEIKKSEEQAEILKKQTRINELTGLPNELSVRETLKKEISRAKRTGETISISYTDIDKFKNINDTYGHKIGDNVIKYVANTFNAGINRSSEPRKRSFQRCEEFG